MKSTFMVAIVMLYSSISVAQAPVRTKGDLKKLVWLVGEWKRTNTKAGRSGSETWMINKQGELGGWAVTMKGTDTVLVEKFKLVLQANNIYYIADVPENKDPVLFKLTSISNNAFVCENPAHDFPKAIAYQRQGTTMKATISGDGKSIDYLFEKM